MKIEKTLSPSSAQIDFLTAKLNEETPEKRGCYPFAFLVRDDSGQIIAGCNGSVVYGCVYTDQLWVHRDYRKQGLGKKLLQQVHELGCQSGCNMATVCTMSFQHARGFYERLGYEVDFERSGHVENSSCLFMKKTL